MRRLVVVALTLAACRPPARAADPMVMPRVLPTMPVCALARAPREHADTLRIVLPHAVDPALGPAGASETERLVFAQLYEPLLRQDCAGDLGPGLAESWGPLGDSAWRFRLRPGARFGDGTPATGAAVAAALKGVALPWRVAEAGERDVVIHGGGDPRLPADLARARWAVTRDGGPGGWRIGTRGTITAAPHGVMLAHGTGVLVFSWPAGTDARDALDGGADGVLTDHPAAIEYAAARAAFDALALPWSRTYVMVTPPGRSALATGAGPWRDAVRVDARPAAGPFWWTTAKCNGGTAAPSAAPATGARVVYPDGDDAARGLAERLVARGLGPVVALAPADLRAAVAGGAEVAIVVLPRSAGDPCALLATRGLAGRAIADLTPVLDTRLHLVVRAGRFGVSLDGDGTPRLDP